LIGKKAREKEGGGSGQRKDQPALCDNEKEQETKREGKRLWKGAKNRRARSQTSTGKEENATEWKRTHANPTQPARIMKMSQRKVRGNSSRRGHPHSEKKKKGN